MKKKVVVGAALMMMPLVSFAGGYLTNTNQHAAFLRSLSRGAAIDIDGALSNPAGLSFLPLTKKEIGPSPVSLPLRVGAVRHRLTMACRCSNRQLWLVYSRKVWGSI